MSNGIQPVETEMSSGEALAILVTLAAGASLTESMVGADPARLAPQLARERVAFDIVEEFLQIHLYGDCKPCA